MSGLLWRALVALLRLVVGRRRARPQMAAMPDLGQGTRVLLIRVDERLGNLILTAPVLESLRRAWPGARIHALVADRKAEIWSRISAIDALHRFEKRWLFRAPRRLLGLLRELCAAEFDVVIDASHAHAFSATHTLLAAACGAPMVIAHDRGPDCGVVTHRVPDPGGYEVERKLSLLDPLEIAARSRRLLYPGVRRDAGLGSSGGASASGLHALRVRELRLLVHAGGRKEDHRYPLAHYAILLSRLRARHGDALSLTYLWGPGEDRLARALRRAVGAGELAPPTNVDEMAALLASADALLCGDTGPMHLAVAVGTPTCALFVRSDPRRWGHAFEPHLVVEPTDLEDIWTRLRPLDGETAKLVLYSSARLTS